MSNAGLGKPVLDSEEVLKGCVDDDMLHVSEAQLRLVGICALACK